MLATHAAVVEMAYRPPLDWTGLLAWYSVRCVAGTERVDLARGTYSVVLALPGGPARATVSDDPGRARLTADLELADPGDRDRAVHTLRRLLDLDADPGVVDAHLAGQEHLARLVVAAPGIRIPGTPTPLEALMRALTGQQVTVAAGRAQLERLVGHASGGSATEFPDATAFLAADLAGYRGPAARLTTLRDALELAADGAVDPARTPEEVATTLAEVRGIGPWTIAYTLLRGYGHPDVDLSTDRAVINAASSLGIASVREVLAACRPWRSYAALRLWQQVV